MIYNILLCGEFKCIYVYKESYENNPHWYSMTDHVCDIVKLAKLLLLWKGSSTENN